MDVERMRQQAQSDQDRANLTENAVILATSIGAFFRQLLNEGFERSEALALTVAMYTDTEIEIDE